ncbi:late embryogenesis abundant protein, LEA-14 [Tanacetum coccineum]
MDHHHNNTHHVDIPSHNHRNYHPSSNNNLTPPPSHTTFSNHYPHHHHNNHHSTTTTLRGCCCCLILLLSFILLLTLAVILVIILAVKPKKPQFNLQQVSVQYISLTPLNPQTTSPTLPTSASLSLAVNLLFTAKNDNKVGIKYGVSTFNIMYRGIPLGRGSVPGFYQPAHSVRRVESRVNVERVNLLQTDAANLLRDVTVSDRVELRIMGDVSAKIKILGLTSPSVQTYVAVNVKLVTFELFIPQ